MIEGITTSRPIVKKQGTKCRSCGFYLRVKKGHWKEPDWKSKAAICSHPDFKRCKHINTIIGEKDYYKPNEKYVVPYNIQVVNDHQQFIAGWRKRSFSARAQADREIKRWNL